MMLLYHGSNAEVPKPRLIGQTRGRASKAKEPSRS